MYTKVVVSGCQQLLKYFRASFIYHRHFWENYSPNNLSIYIFSLIPRNSTFVTLVLNSFFPGAGDVWFSLNGTTYQNNSVVTLQDIGQRNDIGEGDDALLCRTDITDCCRYPYSDTGLGNWFFPNRSRVPSSNKLWDFHRTRGRSVVHLNRRRGGANGIYSCEISVPQSDAGNVILTIFIGVYTASTGKTPLKL